MDTFYAACHKGGPPLQLLMAGGSLLSNTGTVAVGSSMSCTVDEPPGSVCSEFTDFPC